MHPKLPFQLIDLNLPGISYGEFALAAGDERLAPFDASLRGEYRPWQPDDFLGLVAEMTPA